VSAVDIKRRSENSEHESRGQNEGNFDFKTGGTCVYHSALESSVLCMLAAGGFLSGALERET
jgi:hypothetical protein